MKNIKYFKYINTKQFNDFLNDYGYTLNDVEGFSVLVLRRYNSNVLKTYAIYFNDGEYEYFNVVEFKSFNEYNQAGLGFSGQKLLSWYQDSNIRKYRIKDIYGMDDRCVITD